MKCIHILEREKNRQNCHNSNFKSKFFLSFLYRIPQHPDDNITIHTNTCVDYTNIDITQRHIEISSGKHGNGSTGKKQFPYLNLLSHSYEVQVQYIVDVSE